MTACASVQLHWLPIEWHIRFKLATLRSSSSHQLSVLVTTYLLDLVLFDFLLPESGIHYLSASVYLSHFLLSDVI